MPTPTGKLKAGDRIRHKPTGRVFKVVEREGNDMIYSVILTPDDGLPLPPTTMTVFDRPNHFRLLEVPYWLSRTYELVIEERK